MTSITAVPTGGMAVTIVPSGGLPVTLVSATGVATGFARAQAVTASVPLTTGLLTTVSSFGLLAPLTYAKAGGNANLTLNTSTGGISATAALTAGASQTLNGTATGSDGVVIPFTATLTGQVPAPVFTVQPSISPSSGLVGATFTATDGTASNTTTYTRRWLLDGNAIGTGTTIVPVIAGSLVLEVTATGAGGATVATSTAVTVSAAGGGGTVGSFVLNPASDPTAYPPALTVELPPELDYATSPTIRVRRATAENMTTGLVTPSAVAIPSSGPVNLGLSGISSGTWYFQADILVGGVVTYTSNIALHGNATAPTITSAATFTTPEQADYPITITADRTFSLAIIGGRDPNVYQAQSGYGTSRTLTKVSESVTTNTDRTVIIEVKGLNGITATQTITTTVTPIDRTPDVFTFTPVANATASTLYTSNVITIAGLATGYAAPVSITGGTYSKSTDGGTTWSAYSSTPGTAVNGDKLRVQQTSSGSAGIETDVVLTVGLGSATYAVTTFTSAMTWATTNGANRSLHITASGSPLVSAAGDADGDYHGIRSPRAVVPNKFHIEFTVNTMTADGMIMGFDDGANDFTNGMTLAYPWSLPNIAVAALMVSGSFSLSFTHVLIDTDATAASNHFVDGTGAAGGVAAPGDVIIIEGDRTTGVCSFYTVRSGTSTVVALGTQTLSYMAGKTNWYPIFAARNFGAVTMNGGNATLAMPLTSGFSKADGS